MELREDELDEMISNLSSYVQNASDGDPEKIRSAGFEVRAEATPIGELERPLNVKASHSDFAGCVDLMWKTVYGAKSYVIETSADGTNGWQICGHSTRRTFTVEHLPAPSHQWFRVAAIGAAGQGPWSDPVKGLVG